jgi:N-acylneuraminate cytidylyltransferase
VEVLAIIPARGSSRGIPKKNIKDLCGHPLLAYSVTAAVQSEKVTRVICSTDDEEIAEIANEYGAEIPFLRPNRFAQDKSQDIELFIHALEWFKSNENYCPDYVVQLRPTSPVRLEGVVDKAISELEKNTEFDSIRSICKKKTKT